MKGESGPGEARPEKAVPERLPSETSRSRDDLSQLVHLDAPRRDGSAERPEPSFWDTGGESRSYREYLRAQEKLAKAEGAIVEAGVGLKDAALAKVALYRLARVAPPFVPLGPLALPRAVAAFSLALEMLYHQTTALIEYGRAVDEHRDATAELEAAREEWKLQSGLLRAIRSAPMIDHDGPAARHDSIP
jgi:hypothetical protein